MLHLPFTPIVVYIVYVFHQLGCVLCICVYSRFVFQTSLMQAAEGRQQWIANLGSGEIRSRAATPASICVGCLSLCTTFRRAQT